MAAPPWAQRALLGLTSRKLLREVRQAAKDVRKTQHDLLLKLLKTNQHTAFGRDHGFAHIRHADDYRRHVPVRDYEAHRAYINRVLHGESNVLFPGRPTYYNTTSGTSDKPKLIPQFPAYAKQAYGKIGRLWLYSLVRDNPSILNGKDLVIVGAAEEGRAQDGVAYGAQAGQTYRDIPKLFNNIHAIPYPLVEMADYEKRYYAFLRYALTEDIRLIVAVNPSTVLQIHRVIVANLEDFIRDIHDGKLKGSVASAIPERHRASLLQLLKPQVSKAKELEALWRKYQDNLKPKHYWPNLQVLTCWKQGNCAQMLPHLLGYLPDTCAIREFGYSSSECRAGFVLSNNFKGSVLSAQCYHFEFIPLDQANQDHPDTLLAHEVNEGEQYLLCFTTAGGLYRYFINDVIEITGFYDTFPVFTFIRKGDGVTSLTGEKLTETQVIQAARIASDSVASRVPFYIMACDEQALVYKVFVEFPDHLSQDDMNSWLIAYDNSLADLNNEWQAKRGSNRLDLPKLYRLQPDASDLLKKKAIESGFARDGQYKMQYLQRKPEYLRILESLSNRLS